MQDDKTGEGTRSEQLFPAGTHERAPEEGTVENAHLSQPLGEAAKPAISDSTLEQSQPASDAVSGNVAFSGQEQATPGSPGGSPITHDNGPCKGPNTRSACSVRDENGTKGRRDKGSTALVRGVECMPRLTFPVSPTPSSPSVFGDACAAVQTEDSVSKKKLSSISFPSKYLEQKMDDTSSSGFGALFRHYPVDMEDLQQHFHAVFMEDFRRQLEAESAPSYRKTTTVGFLDNAPFVTAAVECLVQDSFSMCFECMPREHWNWNIYLFPMYCMGAILRYAIMFPLRILLLIVGLTAFFLALGVCALLPRATRLRYNQKALQMLAFCWVASWSGVIRYHGVCPPRRPNQIYVANHTTVLDIVVILYDRIVSLVGQRHAGVLGFFQTYVLDCMSNLWFDRMDQNDRSAMSTKIKAHISDPSKPPLLLFPEGTCVNNEYAVMFKRGAFDLDATIIPVAIKYNRLFGDAFWNSKLHSFPVYLARLMTSWCVVADVWYLEPQARRPDETAIEFASRVKQMICDAAGLQPVPWDGYLKYFRPSEREKRARQKIFSQIIKHRFGLQ